MIPIGLSQKKELEYFPNLKPINDPEYKPREILSILVTFEDDVQQEVGYACLERLSTVSVNAHIFIKENHRTPEVISALAGAFKKTMSMYMKQLGCTQLYTSCAGDDVGVKRLMESFGFVIEQHWVGEMNFNT